MNKEKSFKLRVLGVVKKIPAGKTLSYKEVAKRVGNPNAYRAVGCVLNKNFDQSIPCHRVIKNDGSFGGYNKGALKKQKILIKEKNEHARSVRKN